MVFKGKFKNVAENANYLRAYYRKQNNPRAEYWENVVDNVLPQLQGIGINVGSDKKAFYGKIMQKLQAQGAKVVPHVQYQTAARDKWKSYLLLTDGLKKYHGAWMPHTYLAKSAKVDDLITLKREAEYLFGQDVRYHFVYKLRVGSGGTGIRFLRLSGDTPESTAEMKWTENEHAEKKKIKISELLKWINSQSGIIQMFTPSKTLKNETFDVRFLVLERDVVPPFGYMRINGDADTSNIKTGGYAVPYAEKRAEDLLPLPADYAAFAYKRTLKAVLEAVKGKSIDFAGFDIGFTKIAKKPFGEGTDLAKYWREIAEKDYKGILPIIFELNSVPGVKGLWQMSVYERKKVGPNGFNYVEFFAKALAVSIKHATKGFLRIIKKQKQTQFE